MAGVAHERWPVHFLSLPHHRKPLKEVRAVATPFPTVTRECFRKLGNEDVRVVAVRGSTEIMPHLNDEHMFDGIVEIVVSGETARANGLIVYDPPLTHFYPIVVANKSALEDISKADFFNALKIGGGDLCMF